MLMPDLMLEVARLVPFRNGWFGWVGPNLEFANVYQADPLSNEQYWIEYHNTRRERELITTFREVLSSPLTDPVYHPFWHHLRVDYRTFVRSNYYNDIIRPTGKYEPLAMAVQEQGRSRGMLYLWRAEGEPAFGHGDVKMLESIVGFVAHAMTPATVGDDCFANSDNRALFVADRDGMVLHAEEQAQSLLIMALVPRWSPTAWPGLRKPAPEFARLCRSLVDTARGEIGQPPPVLRLRNQWGEFVLRAYWLGPTDGDEQTREIGVTIERRVPRALALRWRVENLPLTGREKQLCLLLAHDRSRQDLADAMGVSTGTVITHQSSLYAKLGVHSRAGLLAALLPV
jgi:DNA-binding CsgD family transcriptional regulator